MRGQGRKAGVERFEKRAQNLAKEMLGGLIF
jgi:hypothetical protein